MVNSSGVVIAGGLARGDVSTTRVVQVDTVAGTATLVGQLAVAVHDTGGAVLHGSAFVFGGGAATTVATVQRISGTGATSVASLPRPRSDLAVVTDSATATAYIAGGFDGSAMDREVLATTDGTTFRTVATLSTGVRYPAVALAAGALWVIGGQLSTAESTRTGGQSDAIQRVDLQRGTVTVAGRLPGTLGHASAFALDGHLYVAGGQQGSSPTSAIQEIDTVSGAVTPAGSLPGPRSDSSVAVQGGTAWLIGGETTDPSHPLDTVVQLRR
jgi:hypothetical protein